MLRNQLIKKGIGSKPDFRLRGTEPTRMDAFTDAVFAFAITLLVVSLEVPQSTSELFQTMQGFIPFGICIILLMQIWFSHYNFSLRYGLSDNVTMYLNILLLFVVLYYVYPLKFLFTFLFKLSVYLFSAIINHPSSYAMQEELFGNIIQHPEDMNGLMVIYGMGAAVIFLIFTFMHLHAYRKREDLELDTIEIFETNRSIYHYILMAAVPIISVVVTLILSLKYTWQAGAIGGFVYMLYPLLVPLFESKMEKRKRILKENIK